jgi:hypothetical protein
VFFVLWSFSNAPTVAFRREWISSCRRNGAMEGVVDFITLDDLQDDVAGCFRDYPVGPAECRSLMKIVVSILESSGFRRSLQAQGKRRLARCLTFDPSPDSLSSLDVGREVMADETVRARKEQNSMRATDGASPSALEVDRDETETGDFGSPLRETTHAGKSTKSQDERRQDVRLEAPPQSAPSIVPTEGDRSGGQTGSEQQNAPVTDQTQPSSASVPPVAMQGSLPMDTSTGILPNEDAPPLQSEMPDHLKTLLKADADADKAVELLLDEMLDDVVDEMNRLEPAQEMAAQKETTQSIAPVAVTPLLQRLAELAQVEDQLVAKYTGRQLERPVTTFVTPESDDTAHETASPKTDSTDKATATAFVDARLALASRHRNSQLTASAFQGWKLEAAQAPRLAAITFSLTTLKIKRMLPRWQRLAWTGASARALSCRHRSKRFFALLCRSTAECRNDRVAQSHYADVQLCRALLLWHDHVQQQQLRDRDLCASLADRVRVNLVQRSWTSWRDAENRLLAFVHSRRSLALVSLHQWRKALGALRIWRRRWNTILRRVAFVSWLRFCRESSLVTDQLQAAHLHLVRRTLRLCLSTWCVVAKEERRLRMAGNALESSVHQRTLRFGLAALRCGTLLNRHCSVMVRRRCAIVWSAWLSEHKLLVHSKNRAFEAWKVFVGMSRLETWLAHVRYTIHGRWVVVDCFYEWKRRATIWVHGRNLVAAAAEAAKSRYLRRWIAAFESRSGDPGASGLERSAARQLGSSPQHSSLSAASAVSDMAERARSTQDGASAALPSDRAMTGVDGLIAQQVAEVRAELGSQYEALQDALAAQQRGLLSDIKTDVGALNQRLATLGLMSPATIDLLRQAANPQRQQPAIATATPGIATQRQETMPDESDQELSQQSTNAAASQKAAQQALLAKIEEAEAARKQAEAQAAAAKAREDSAAREFDAKIAAADAARITAEEEQAAAEKAHEEEARRAVVAAAASAAKVQAAEAARLVAEEAQAAADREREDEIAAVRRKAALEAATAERAALVASEAHEAALKAEAERIREEAAASVAEATRAAEQQAAGMAASEERRRVAVEAEQRARDAAETRERENINRAAEQNAQMNRSVGPNTDDRDQVSASDLDQLHTGTSEQRLDPDTSARISPPVESQVRRVVVQTSATVKPLGDDVSALQLRKEQLRKEQMAQQTRAANQRAAQTQSAGQRSGSDYDDWGVTSSANSRRLGRRAAEPEPLFSPPAVSVHAGGTTAEEEHSEATAAIPSGSLVVISPSTQEITDTEGATTTQPESSPEVNTAPLDDESAVQYARGDENEPVGGLGEEGPLIAPQGSTGSIELEPAVEAAAPASPPAAEEAAPASPPVAEEAALASPPEVVSGASTLNEPQPAAAATADSAAPAAENAGSSSSQETGAIAESPEDREIRQKFEELDTDNSGALDVNELAQLIKELLDADGDEASKKKTGVKQVHGAITHQSIFKLQHSEFCSAHRKLP